MKTTHSHPRTRPFRATLMAFAAALALAGTAIAQTPLDTYDAAINNDTFLNPPLMPAAYLTTPAVLNGTSGVAFDFGVTEGDATIEFILKGNPAGAVSSFLAVGTNTPKSRLVYESWSDTMQLGFTQGGVADYLFTPAVSSPTNDTHVAFVWNPTNTTMKVYINGYLAGTTTGVSPNFVMPSGWGWLGSENGGSSEAMTGTIYRVTVYDTILSDGVIKRHSSAFGAHVRPALDAYDKAIAADATVSTVALLTNTVILNGVGGADFDFGYTSGDATMEFILEGDPTANNTAFLAVAEPAPSSLRFELWNNTGELGFTQAAVADYSFSPGVNSPSLPTHIAYVFDPAGPTMKLYLNGVLAGTRTGVSPAFVMPYGQGKLGNNFAGTEAMFGAIYRVTVYDSMLNDATILSHAKPFTDLLSPPTIKAFTATPETIAPGGSAILSWDVKNSTKVTVNGVDWTGSTAITVSPAVSTTYTLVAQNSLGSVSSKLKVVVAPNLSAYDAAITADAGAGLTPIAKLTTPVVTSGSWTGVPFNFGTNTSDGTMEFILEGDPDPGSGTFIAADYNEAGEWQNSLRYSQWPDAWQMGFTRRAVADYAFTPVVPSPNWPTHVTFLWDATALTMKIYINGVLAGESAEVDPTFNLPSGLGSLGDGTAGVIFRVTSYATKLTEEKIISHAKAFINAASPKLASYDAAIASTATSGPKPVARLLAPITLTGEGGVNFWFGTNSADATIEFILEGDPSPTVSSFLAVSTNNTLSRLTYESWENTAQLGFTQGMVEDYLFTPAVASPTKATHVTYAWNAAATTMKLYTNGVLAGTKSGVSPNFALPSETGVLGDSWPTWEPMVGIIHRVTVYDDLLADAVIASHGKAFVGQSPKVAVSLAGGTITIALSDGIAGEHYRVEYRNSLSSTDTWTLLQDIPSLTGTTINVTDPTPITGKAGRYYRAVLVR